MKNLNAKQIEQVKAIRTWTNTRFHGNTKKVDALLLTDIKIIIQKKYVREIAKQSNTKKSNATILRELIKWSKECKGTGYFKTLIEGNTGIYYASPTFGHSDYNKSRIFDKNEQTLNLMRIFNALVN
jgi:hypothetical protein